MSSPTTASKSSPKAIERVIASTMPNNITLAQQAQQQASMNASHSDTVSQQIMEHLLAELVHYSTASTKQDEHNSTAASSSDSTIDSLQRAVLAAEMSAAKLERIGYQIGYRLTERLAQHKTWNVVSNNLDLAQQTAAQQLEAVKFLCKEVWVQLYGKQIDKLQTNHRGVFVIKDLDMVWLQKFPKDGENSRVLAMQWLALPCGLIRGCLADLGIPSVVSCDFLADGQSMSACSFNVKVK
ncbi:hypothetical protein MPSEU_000624700 [Mayamaea pseudoterrestris]|nr:hypothetical protein MPSEU_000624700 [Mayamaea pseudoterrestris]